MVNRIGLASTAVIVALLVVFVAATVGERAAAPHLRFVVTPWPAAQLVQAAQSGGFFAARRLRVEVVSVATLAEAEQLLERGQVDGGILPYSTALRLADRRGEVAVVANVDYSAGADGIVATAEVRSVPDLKGRRVAFSPEGFGRFLLAEALRWHGLTTADVTVVPLEPLPAVQAYLRGQLEAVVVAEPFLGYAATRAGSRVVFSSTETPGLIPDVVVFRRASLRARRSEVTEFLSAWFDLVAQLDREPARRQHLAVVALATGRSLDEVEQTFRGIKVLRFADNAVAFTHSEDTASLYGSGQRLLELLVASGEVAPSASVADTLDPSFVRSGLRE